MQVRFARHTKRFEEVVAFYREGLALPEIGRFEGHDGYDGVFLEVTLEDPDGFRVVLVPRAWG